MGAGEIGSAVATGLLGAGALAVAVLQFCQKGPIFTNSYLLASPEERQKLDKPAQYRLAGTVFAALALMMLLLTIYILTHWQPLVWATMALAGAVIVYVIVKAIRSGEFG